MNIDNTIKKLDSIYGLSDGNDVVLKTELREILLAHKIDHQEEYALLYQRTNELEGRIEKLEKMKERSEPPEYCACGEIKVDGKCPLEVVEQKDECTEECRATSSSCSCGRRNRTSQSKQGDCSLYGVSIEKDGKRIDPKDFYITSKQDGQTLTLHQEVEAILFDIWNDKDRPEGWQAGQLINHILTYQSPNKISISRDAAKTWSLFHWDRLQNGNGNYNDNTLHQEINKALKESE